MTFVRSARRTVVRRASPEHLREGGYASARAARSVVAMVAEPTTRVPS
ncbi:hypothetical protein BG653_07293 [Streptomyces platensis]|uniref:Uncharacterized protein n=1 Tax=Streptomyces platensis TaxID=58346 RepID=A0ABX3XKG9_STRPT|nr:hypothetical protein BG653_07293 [Streptomyces platensis]